MRLTRKILIGFSALCLALFAATVAVRISPAAAQYWGGLSRFYPLLQVGTLGTEGGIKAVTMTTPVNSTFTTACTGGTLTDATTYYYRIAATNAAGQTLASTETSKATGTCAGANTSTITLTWGVVNGATGFNIYGRTTGAELYIGSTSATGAPPDATFTDDGSVTPTGALPAVESSSTISSISPYHNIVVRGGVQASGLTTPVTRSYSTACTGGTLVFSTTYYYRVSATNASGESLASTETSKATAACGSASTSTVTINWGLITGATGYKIYGRTTGAEQLIGTVTDRYTLTFTDDGSVTPSGALPTVNTTANSRFGMSRLLNANKPTTPVDMTGGGTFTNTQILEASIFTMTGTVAYTFPTFQGSTGLIQALCGGASGGTQGCAVGDLFFFYVANTHASQVVTFTAGTGQTLFKTTSTPGSHLDVWLCRITATTANSETATCY